MSVLYPLKEGSCTLKQTSSFKTGSDDWSALVLFEKDKHRKVLTICWNLIKDVFRTKVRLVSTRTEAKSDDLSNNWQAHSYAPLKKCVCSCCQSLVKRKMIRSLTSVLPYAPAEIKTFWASDVVWKLNLATTTTFHLCAIQLFIYNLYSWRLGVAQCPQQKDTYDLVTVRQQCALLTICRVSAFSVSACTADAVCFLCCEKSPEYDHIRSSLSCFLL